MIRKREQKKRRRFRIVFLLSVVLVPILAVLAILFVMPDKIADRGIGSEIETAVSVDEDAEYTEPVDVEQDRTDADLEEKNLHINDEESEDEFNGEPVQMEDAPETGELTPADQADYSGNDITELRPLRIITNGDYLLALVTKETTLKRDYVPSDLQPIPSYLNPYYNMQLREEALHHLKYMFHRAYEEGVTLSIRSAYRSYATQDSIFRDYAARYTEQEANRFSARPGQSEHQLGTTVDFGGTAYDFTADFAQTRQGEWLKDNAHRFGFAMSYPQGMEAVTGYIFEPWHFRYVGITEANKWKESGKTLKEYLETKEQYFEVDYE